MEWKIIYTILPRYFVIEGRYMFVSLRAILEQEVLWFEHHFQGLEKRLIA